MIENIVVTKLGSEAENTESTVFTSTTPWTDKSSDLMVYRNGVLQNKNEDYQVIDTYTIRFSYSVGQSEQIQFVVTKLSSDELNRDRLIELDRVSKKLEGKAQTSFDKKVYEEELSSVINVHSDDVWTDGIDPDPDTAVIEGIARKVDLVLDEDVTVGNHLGWFASDNHLISSTIKSWIPSRFGRKYTITLYDGNNQEIASSDPIGWHFDYSSGYLFISNKNSRTTPYKISGYIYTGRVGGSGSGGSNTWREPVLSKDLLPLVNNTEGQIRLVTSESQLYRWTGSSWIKVYNMSQSFKDPVETTALLPTSGNTNGDLRLVLSINSIYRWNTSTLEWVDVINRHIHDDRYYVKSEVDDLVAASKTSYLAHTHDNLYYRKEEVNALVRWRPSVKNEAALPPYTENLDGDVILTRDTNTIWRYNYFGNPPAWIPITSALNTWKSPVQTISDLPLSGNRVGDTRLVISLKEFYFWDGTQWISTKVGDHNHDDLYYRKEYIDSLNFNWKAPVPTENNLPTSGNATGDVRLTVDTLSAYFWDSSKWVKWTASPKWREPVLTIANLPSFNNSDGDVRFVTSENFIYTWSSASNKWSPISIPSHTHDDRYYTKLALDNGQLDSRYYIKSEIDEKFDTTDGHDHDGISSKRIDYNNLLNIPVFYWMNPVYQKSDLPISGNKVGDTRIVIEDSSAYTWDGTEWNVINNGIFALKDHEHDTRYYQKSEIDDLIEQINNEMSAQLMTKADRTHEHDDRYYQKAIVDQLIADKFNIETGHAHTGKDSARVSYYDLKDIPAANMDHNHDERYFTKTQLETSGESQVNWDNLTNKPDLGNTHWKSPVQDYVNLPAINNEVGDIRLVLNDSDIYEWVGNQWVNIGHWDNKYVNYWKEPVDNYSDLPIINNVDGDVRLVKEENAFYRWNQQMRVWTAVIQTESDAQVYLNGDHLFGEGIEWARTREREIQLKIPAQAGDKVTLILKYEYKTLRKDFVAYSGQNIFNFATGYYREDYIASEGQTVFSRTHAYLNGENALLVWLNGVLQRVNIDYQEDDSYTFHFINQLVSQDRVISISLEHASGEGEYIREDYIGSLGQKEFVLENAYTLSGGNLIVYLNGLLQRVNVDYQELNSSKIGFYNSCAQGDYVTFIIFNQETINSIYDADQIALGNAKDGSWSDGMFEFYSAYKVAYALDDINEALLEVAPSKPNSLQSLDFELEGITLYSGYESIGSDNYEGSPGSYRSYLTENGTFNLYTKGDDAFSDADSGILALWINGVKVDEFNLYNAFVELNKKEKQTSVNYGIQANGARSDEGVAGTNGAIRNSINGMISIISVQPHNNFSLYQKAKARFNISSSSLKKGYNSIYATHQTDTKLSTSMIFKFFWDNSASRPEIVDSVNIEESEILSKKYVSGIRYYSISDKFHADFVVSRAFNNTFTQIPIKINMTGLNEYEIEYDNPDITGVSIKPEIGEVIDYNGYFRLNKYNEYNIDSKMNVSTYDPFGEGQEMNSSSVNRLINTFTNGSTDKIEYFRDELFRLPAGDYNTWPAVRKNVWDSTVPLEESQALLFDMKLQYANKSFLGYKPDQIADYSTFTQPQFYYRAFYDNLPHNNGTFIISGITEDNLKKNKLYIDLKLPTQTGWLSLNSNYDITTFTGSDGDGCLLRVDNNNFMFSTGQFSTAKSGYMIIVRIKIDINSPNISYMELL